MIVGGPTRPWDRVALTSRFRLKPFDSTISRLPSTRFSLVVSWFASQVRVLSELVALYCFSGSNQWLSFSSNLSLKPRSPILSTLSELASTWISQWKLFSCTIA
ncbi:hypothetical protein G4B88_002751 [Cannabis sativa]|uniref:Uncharacterized protein n=1 Tax=Cannabis sativa TaxID=3483 RepID=A0A7J6HHW6_CANSA|nr:hypothetical protein G4B88_002751 [Cannabis sativa]